MYRQPFSPWNYTSCMRDCLAAPGTSEQECHGACSHYASMPIAYTVPMTYGGMNQAAPYIPQPYYYPYSYPVSPYSYFPMQSSIQCPSDTIKMLDCDSSGTRCRWVCRPI